MSMLLAAGVATVVAVATLAIAGRGASSPAVATRSDTVHIVRLVYVDSTARQIAVVGDFNGWSAEATPLIARDGTGMWTASITLPPGTHQYAFVVDGAQWVADPFALSARDEFGTPTSMLTLGATEAGATE
jgi:1,4-alpha-glucan branching enzyme